MDEIQRVEYGNGLRVLLEERANTKKAALLIGVRVGSVDEYDGINGGSHFNEHLLFKSNKHRTSRQITEDLEYSGTVINAYTTWKYTAFYAKTPYTELENAVQILYEAATNLDYKRKEFELEREVVLTEIRNYINSPDRYALTDLFIPTLFHNTPLEKKIQGTVDAMSSVEKSELEDFKGDYYSPGNIVIVVCGNFNEKKLLGKVEDTFGSMQKGKTHHRERVDLSNRHTVREESRGDINQMYLSLGYRVPGYSSDDFFKLDLLSSILSEGLSSRLFKELREKRGIGYSVGSFYKAFQDEGMFISHVDGFNPLKLEETQETIEKVFNELKEEKIGGREFEGTKKLMLSKYDDQLERITESAMLLLESEFCDIPFDYREKDRYIKAVSEQDLMDVANKYLGEDYTMTLLKPEDG